MSFFINEKLKLSSFFEKIYVYFFGRKCKCKDCYHFFDWEIINRAACMCTSLDGSAHFFMEKDSDGCKAWVNKEEETYKRHIANKDW